MIKLKCPLCGTEKIITQPFDDDKAVCQNCYKLMEPKDEVKE